MSAMFQFYSHIKNRNCIQKIKTLFCYKNSVSKETYFRDKKTKMQNFIQLRAAIMTHDYSIKELSKFSG